MGRRALRRGGGVVLVVAALGSAGAVWAATPSLQQRVERLERVVNGPGMVDMLSQIQSLQRQVQELSGREDVLQHRIDDLQRRQRDLYLDIDQRLRRLEVKSGAAPGGGNALPSPGAAAPASAPATPAASTAGAAAGAGSGTGSTASLQVQSEYEAALGLLQAGKYAKADQAFRSFLKVHPDSAYADNAEYWLGEANYVTRSFGAALKAFQAVVQRYPRSPKVPDALLKIGYIQYEQKDWKAARKTLTEVIAHYPDSSAARLAEQRKQRMKVEGH